jgi:hypothetical protein
MENEFINIQRMIARGEECWKLLGLKNAWKKFSAARMPSGEESFPRSQREH